MLDLDQHSLRVGDVVVPATSAEFGLLRLLITRRNVPMSKEALLTALFGPQHGRDARLIDVFVARLRRSLSAFGLDGLIATVAGRGYAIMEGGEDETSLPFPVSGEPSVSLLAA